MQRATHWVTCRELEATHGSTYVVKAVKVGKDWRLAERGFGMYQYGMILTGVKVMEKV